MSVIIPLATNNSTLVLNGYTFTNLIAGDTIELAPQNDLTSRINSMNGGVTINRRIDADVYRITINVQKDSADDVFLNTIVNNGNVGILNGSLTENFIKDNTDSKSTWNLENGSIVTRPTLTINNTDGNASMQYVIEFRSAIRAI